jgi:hypothetical protein
VRARRARAYARLDALVVVQAITGAPNPVSEHERPDKVDPGPGGSRANDDRGSIALPDFEACSCFRSLRRGRQGVPSRHLRTRRAALRGGRVRTSEGRFSEPTPDRERHGPGLFPRCPRDSPPDRAARDDGDRRTPPRRAGSRLRSAALGHIRGTVPETWPKPTGSAAGSARSNGSTERGGGRRPGSRCAPSHRGARRGAPRSS